MDKLGSDEFQVKEKDQDGGVEAEEQEQEVAEAIDEDTQEVAVEIEEEFVEPHRCIGGFWRRVFAFLTDGAILAFVGGLASALLAERAYTLGNWALLGGFLVALIYFGIMNSRIGNGRTVGKLLCGLQVVDVEGNTISVPTSFLRSAIVLISLMIGDLSVSPFIQHMMVYKISMPVIQTILSVSLLYLLIFNQATRQLSHDLLFGTYVVKSGETGTVVPKAIWKGHFQICAVLIVLTLLVPIAISKTAFQNVDFKGMETIQDKVYALGDMQDVGVMENHYFSNGEQRTNLIITVIKRGRPQSVSDNEKSAICNIALSNYKDIQKVDYIGVNYIYRFNTGFFKLNGTYNDGVAMKDIVKP